MQPAQSRSSVCIRRPSAHLGRTKPPGLPRCRNPSFISSSPFLSRASLSLSSAPHTSDSEPRRRRKRRRRHRGPSCRRARSPSGERAAVKRLCVGSLYPYPHGCISATNTGAVWSFPHDGGDGSGEVSHRPCFSLLRFCLFESCFSSRF